ncbi:GGDEF domain-containing protein [Sulfurimonas sp.]|uniref:GGDEF domain-containing protein n=1 Tax=Sulfurimonas sp. TaxID=2022749 RepID=UPI0025D6122F|nr:GGDEF domain-containing protein [Sulfurimonas sp.]MDD5157524.1 GGDEF domain-containing protein [Sulfurimonas sp.]
MKSVKYYIFGLVALFVLAGSFYFEFLTNEHAKIKNTNYEAEALFMRKKLISLIAEKQKTITTIALSIANDKKMHDDILNANIDKHYYEDLILKFDRNALCRNIWIEIFDKELKTPYKSWSNVSIKDDGRFRQDVDIAVKLRAPLFSVTGDLNGLLIREIVPLFNEAQNIGAIEVISNLNSTIKELKNFDIDTKIVIKKDKLKKYPNELYEIKDDKIIVLYEITDIDNVVVANILLSKNINSKLKESLDFFIFKWSALSVFGILILTMVIIYMGYHRSKKQKKYYKNIIDLSSNIVVIVDKNRMIDVNRAFFKYFYGYRDIEEFKQKHSSISDFFTDENDYLRANIDGLNWIEYLVKNNKSAKVKLIYDEKIYYFVVCVSLISEEDSHYSAVFSDVTKDELHNKELEETTITDPLTKIRNRYFYNIQIKKESAEANRYFYPLSLVILDMDFFKKINDTYGHDVGDSVLIEYSKLIGANLRESDIFCRIGGEEFALILPHTDRAGAYKIADSLRIKVEAHKKIASITMSFGVVEYKKGEDLEFTFKRADEALYEAKHNGRNRVVVR